MPRNNAASSADPLADHKRYEKSKNLNAGAFGFVQLAKDKLNKGAYVAVKFIPRGEHINEYVEAEIINHRQLLHPHIIQFQEVRLPRRAETFDCQEHAYAEGAMLTMRDLSNVPVAQLERILCL